MLNVYVVEVWHASQPACCETIEVRTHSAKRAQYLARESFPGCMARATSMFVDGAWYELPLFELKTKAA
jgi:hypothetical protein